MVEFKIEHKWNGFAVSHDPVTIKLAPANAGLFMDVTAPFYNDPPAPPSDPGKPFNGLWDYEVVEAFFLNGQTEQYLEVELCPYGCEHTCSMIMPCFHRHGQYLILLLCGRRKVLKQELPLKFEVSRTCAQWNGRALLPWNYLPPATDQFNAFAIHGSGEARTYEALYPVPKGEIQKDQQPDFHRLEYFKCLNLKALMGEGWKQPVSDFWAPCKQAS